MEFRRDLLGVESSPLAATPSTLELVAHQRYAEMEAGDSIWALWRRADGVGGR